jgi:hypothetical protein
MIQKVFLAGLAFVFCASPMVASASMLTDFLDQARFLASRAAAVNANYDPSKIDCVAVTSVESARIGEKFLVAWGSWGAVDAPNTSNWAPNGAYMIVVDTPGTYLYKFTFQNASAASTSCEKRVIVK